MAPDEAASVLDRGRRAGLMPAMISVVIATLDDERTLGETLAALVPAAVDGLVREVILADGGSTDATLDIADDAGARVVAAPGDAAARTAAACATARGDWLLIMASADVPPPGWERAVQAHLRAGVGQPVYWGGQPRFLRRPLSPALLMPRRLYERDGEGAGRSAKPLKIG